MKYVTKFLEENNFIQEKHNIWSNQFVDIVIEESGYEVIIKEDSSSMLSQNLNIYWLIGVLTYNGWMEKNYIIPTYQNNEQ
jgi:hypothetical protein